MITFKLYNVGRIITEVMLCSSQCILSSSKSFPFVLLLITFTLVPCLRLRLPDFFMGMLFFPPFDIKDLWGQTLWDFHQTFNLFTYLYLHGFMISYFIIIIKWGSALYYFYLFWYSNYSWFGQWELIQSDFHILFTHVHNSLNVSLFSGPRCSRFKLYFP